MATFSSPFPTTIPNSSCKLYSPSSTVRANPVLLRANNLDLAAHKVFARLPKRNRRINRLRCSAVEDEGANPVVETRAEGGEEGGNTEQPTVSVPVSPSDTLTMYFQAEGTMSDAAIGMVTKALEGTEGITNLKVQILEGGIGSVELTKDTTIQATGVASSLVETIQGAGFKLQTLNLSFEDQGEVLVS